MVEALETLFIPLAIYNNQAGADAAVLARFEESSWNNPVMRFVNAEGRDWIPRRDGIYTLNALLPRMTEALRATKADPPTWLAAAVEEATAPRETATFAQS